MRREDYFRWAERTARWGAEYLATLDERPVRAQTAPGEIAAMLPAAPPEEPEDMETIFADFERIVPDGMTHWQHPRFFAYFPGNAAPVSMIAENLTAVLAAQCMLWQTSPAATEIETRMVEWMRQALGLPEGFVGVIQESATSANICAVLTMRERALDWRGNDSGMAGEKQLRVYASPETHSSIDKAIRIAGIGQQHLVKIPTDGSWALDPVALRRAINADLAAGFRPAGLVLCVGGTSIGASDRLHQSIAVAREHDLYVHVDAAWAGSAMICPELRGRCGRESRALTVSSSTRTNGSAHTSTVPSNSLQTRNHRFAPWAFVRTTCKLSANPRSPITASGQFPSAAGFAPSSSGSCSARMVSKTSDSASETTSPGPGKPLPPSHRWMVFD